MISCQVVSTNFFPISRFVNSLKDFSTNGFKLNGYEVRRSSVLLMDGDIMELPSSRSGNYLSYGTPEATADPSSARIRVHTTTSTI